jgi:hypothetical protein
MGFPIAGAAKLGVTYSPNDWPEACTFGIHTGKRDPADWNDLLVAWFEIFNHLTTVLPACTPISVTYSEWETSGGFTGWHQKHALALSGTVGSGSALPHQLALVIGYRNLTDSGIPLGRRRNRFYVGPLKQSILQTDGRISAALRTSLFSEMQDLDDELLAVPAAAAGGFAVVSPAEGEWMDAEQFTMGLRFDVVRSRAQHQAESVAFDPIV